jgi:hypothetical protein
MTGHLGYRAFGDFAKYQQRHLTKYFRIRRRKVPSYSTIRRAVLRVKGANLIKFFNQWASQLTNASDESKWLAIDGKSLNSTLEHYGRHQQNFLSRISVFCQDNKLVWPRAKL